MRVVALAIVVGVALGFALLDAFVDEARPLVSSSVSPTVDGDHVPRPIQRSAANDELLDSVGPASHGDSNTDSDEKTPELNSNVIAGQPTTICTSDSRLGSALATAVQRWNNALSEIGTVFTIVAATPASGPGVDVTTSVCGRVNVELVWRSPETHCDNDLAHGTRACLLDKGTTSPPRLGFRNTKSALNLRNRSVVVYQVPSHLPVNIGTLVHELGHALGLRHYDDDTACRDLHDPTIDPLSDHFTAMTYPGAETASGVRCDARGVVTGRDLRDFYEAYRVGAITNVRLDGSASEARLGTPRPLSFTLWWGADGIAEANHNASHIAVLRQPSGSTSWSQVGNGISVRDNNGVPMKSVTVEDDSGVAALYKVVGLTRGDIRRQGNFDVVRSFRIPGATAGTTTTATFTEGDPTYIKGVAAYTENGTQIEVSGPNVLSASVSPRYCYANNSLAVSMLSSGGSSTATESVTDAASNAALDSTSVPCRTVTGQRSFTAKAVWGSGATKVTRTISLPVNVHARPVRVNSVSATIEVPDPTNALNTISRTITSCTKGEQVTLSVSTGSPRPAIELWANGTKLPGSVFTCPDVTGSIQILALRPDGGGVALTMEVFEPLTVAFTGKSANGETCTIAQLAKAEINITGGKPPYDVTLGSGNASEVQAAGTLTRHYRCPAASGTSQLSVAVVDSANHRATASVTLTAVPMPTPPANLTTTGTTATTTTATWAASSGPSGAAAPSGRSYVLWYSGAPSSVSTANTRYTLTDLIPYEGYNIYVRSVNAAGTQSAASRTSVTMPGRPGVPRTAAPTRLQTSNITNTSATLSWNAVPGATRYRVWRSNGSSVTLPSTARSYTFTGLLPSRGYSLMVWAFGNGGISPFARVVIETSGPKPATPTGLRTSTGLMPATTPPTATQATATLTWNAVPGAARYGLWWSGGRNVYTTNTSYTFENLIPYAHYSLYVWALDSAGHKSINARISVRLPGRSGETRTATPTGVQVSEVTTTSAKVSWNAVPGATSYYVWRSGSSGVRLSGTTQSYRFTNLKSGWSYRVRIWAYSFTGVSEGSRKIAFRIPAATLGSPDPLSVGSATQNNLTLSWPSVSGAAGYEVKRTGSSRVWTVSGTSYRFTGLTAGTTYTLSVQAKSGSTRSAWASESGVTVPPWPGVPRSSATHNSLTLTWLSVRGATGYEVKRGYYGTVETVAPGKTSHTFGGLSSGWSYTLYVRATNAGGKSRWRSQTDTTLLPDPTGVRVSGKTSSSLTLSWTLDSRAIWYQVKRVPGSGATTTSRSSYTFSGLNANTSYTLYVRVWGGSGWSGWSSTSARTAPPPPSGLTVSDIDKTSVKLTWAAASGASGYEVRKNSGSATAVSGTEYTFSSLTLDTAYTLEVRSKSGSRASRWVSTTTRTAAFEARLRARRLSNGRVEFCIQVDSQIGTTSCIKPTHRFVTPSTMAAGSTQRSSSVSATIGGVTRTIGRISATKPAGATYLKICFIPHGGTEVCPASNSFRWASSTVNLWQRTATKAYQLPPAASGAAGASGVAESDDHTMDAAGSNEPDPPWAEGGSME